MTERRGEDEGRGGERTMKGGEAKGAARGPPCASPQHIGAPHKAIPPKPSFLRETRGETRSDCCNGGGAPKMGEAADARDAR